LQHRCLPDKPFQFAKDHLDICAMLVTVISVEKLKPSPRKKIVKVVLADAVDHFKFSVVTSVCLGEALKHFPMEHFPMEQSLMERSSKIGYAFKKQRHHLS